MHDAYEAGGDGQAEIAARYAGFCDHYESGLLFWHLDQLHDVLEGAGFEIAKTRALKGKFQDVQLECLRARTLPDIV